MTVCPSASCPSLKGVGYGSGDMPMPIVSGQDAEIPSVKSILRGRTVFDHLQGHPRTGRVTVGMVDALLRAASREINDTDHL